MKLFSSLTLLVLAACALARNDRWVRPVDDIPADAPVGSQADVEELIQTTRQALHGLPPLVAQIQLSINLLGQDMQWTGQYVQAGFGTPHYLWDLSLADESSVPSRMTQVFDGRFLYSLHQSPLGSELTYADLSQLSGLAQRNQNQIASANAWQAIGGLSSLLEHLETAFAFEDAGSKTSSGSSRTTFRVVRGEWTEAALRELLREEINPKWFSSGIQWDRLPKQLPHGVEIWIGSDPYLPSFPYRMVFFQYERTRLGGWQTVPRVVVTLHQVRLVESLPAETFRVSSENLQPIDLTADYVNRSKMYLLYPAVPSPR